MGTFLLLLLIIFIFWPIVRTLYRLSQARKAFRDNISRAQQEAAQRQADEMRSRRRPGWSRPAQQPPKRYSSTEGEYVEWEDVSTDTSTTVETDDSSTTTRTHTRTQRITDAEWEDIP